MDTLDRETLNRLLTRASGPAVTIYLPMHTSASPPHISENKIRLKNLIHEAAQRLSGDAGGHALAVALLARLDELQDDQAFWEHHQTPGLLICASSEGIDMYNLPIDTEEYVAVDSYFHLAPVLGLLHDARDFNLLVLAQHNPRLYKGGLFDLEASATVLPATIKQALNLDELNQKLESQGTATGPSSHGAAGQPSFVRGWFNGRGGAHNPAAEEKLRFFRIIDHEIGRALDTSLPLILAGPEEDTALYRSISHYPRLLRGAIAGNHGSDNPRALFDAAQAIVWQELVLPDHQAAVNEYQQISGANPGRVAHTLKAIRDAAAEGRVDKLFARLNIRTTDTVRDKYESVPRITFPDDATESKHLNDVALSVWRNSGTIYTLLPSEMPNGELMAARLRY